MKKAAKHNPNVLGLHPVAFYDRLLSAASRHHAMALLLVVCGGIVLIGGFVIRDLEAANLKMRTVYMRSVHGLQRIGELQYDAQETRRATLYALTTSDSNLQLVYADESRDADARVTGAIAEYSREAKQPPEIALAGRLARDWASYLSVRDDVLAAILEGSLKDAVNLDLASGASTFERVRQDLEEMRRLYDQDASQRQRDFASSSRRAVFRLVGILSLTFLVSSAAVWTIQRSRMLEEIQLARLQMEFVASVSHELRTPLAVLMSAADNLADGLVAGREAMQKYGAIVRRQSRGIGDLVNEILLFASTEDGKKHYALEAIEVAPLIHSIAAGAEGLMKESKAALDVQIAPNCPPVVGDRTGIAQCLQNLIGNAVKYGGADKRVALRVYVAQTGDTPGGEVRIAVRDRGLGIDSSEIARIFDPFYRSPRVRAAQIHGTGLGLSLAKRIAEAMGGRLSVASELAMGSTFTLHLRIAKGDEPLKKILLAPAAPS